LFEFNFHLRLRVKIWFSVPISVTPKMVRRVRGYSHWAMKEWRAGRQFGF